MFNDFLKEAGIDEENQVGAIKKLIAFQLEEAMRAQKLSKVAMAKLINTSRSQLD
jgi:antitoxin HicB